MDASINIFDKVVNENHDQTPIILILSKSDMLEDMLYSYHLKDYFSDYNGENVQDAFEFILQKFLSQNKN